MPVSIIIVNYNTKDLILNCIKSIYAHHDRKQFEIIVVDNHSTDDSVSALSIHYPDIKIIINKENKGFGSANNQGVNEAIYEYVLLLNSDTIIEFDILTELEQFMGKHKNCAGVSPEILYPDKIKQNTYGNYPTISFCLLNALQLLPFCTQRYKQKYAIGLPSYFKEPAIVPHIIGVSMFLRKDAFKQVGGFDENFFLYFEETDLCYRIQELGYKFYVNPHVYVLHLLSKSSPNSIFKTKHLLKSRIYYFKKRKTKGIWIIKCISSIKLLIESIRHKDINYLKLISNLINES